MIKQKLLFKILALSLTYFVAVSCVNKGINREIVDFNFNWQFHLGDIPEAFEKNFNDDNWKSIKVPHDWSIEEGYLKTGETASSTGFVPGGMGWYRKTFTLKPKDKEKHISIMFDGVYNNSSVWINGHLLGTRPNGYISFSYNLTEYLNFDGSDNVIAVKVDHSAYVDSRWYTGSGIYRKVQLIKKHKLHIKQWGVQIRTPFVNKEKAKISIKTTIENGENPNLTLQYNIVDSKGTILNSVTKNLGDPNISNTEITINDPLLWSIDNPNLYNLKVALLLDGHVIDNTSETFGLRTFRFDANTGFYLNDKSMKLKGVNLHHDAGAVGSAVPKGIWKYRIEQLKSIGVNAIRFSHNPHAKELLEVCDELGLLVMNEAFDEWYNPKKKSKVYLGDNAASAKASLSYPSVFNEWAERDLKDLILRDFNHPSVFMWSIGNEIEWTFPHYLKTFNEVNITSGEQGYEYVPIYDNAIIKETLESNINKIDPLAHTAQQLVSWVKEIDTTRPITCGSVLPSIGMVSGYGTAVDVFGFNYRASDYDIAHKTYPNLKILGTENWGDYWEWKNCTDRDFVSGIFVWTGFAYMGEAGPWPRKGLEISFFDFAGFKTPRGHFFECLWNNKPKVYMVTTPAKESEYSYKDENWEFNMELTPPPVWKMLRKWEWYKVYPKWKYTENENIIVQTYTNCEAAELFLNGTSLGRQKLANFSETDNIIKWLVPYTKGELKVIGYNGGIKADEYVLNTNKTKIAKINLESSKNNLSANGYDVSIITATLFDDNNNLIIDGDTEIEFTVSGPAKNIGVDNGWEMNIQPHKTNKVITHNGKAILIIQSTKESGNVEINCKLKDKQLSSLKLTSN
ncbi:sugar-binding domain-containing protein [uncultured Algibacter sp.]|uniref:sugar-binding domain-containing protein n=1 Tax=uncultured Algibacter sp. TaxID=298659 RepID=UPI00260855D1|nr:sugar-binding domain-containing protein [uncultured Algibacter sp.]